MADQQQKISKPLPESIQNDYKKFFQTLIDLKNSLKEIEAVKGNEDHQDNYAIEKLKATICYAMNSLFRALIKLENDSNIDISELVQGNKEAFKILKEFNLHEEFKKNMDLSIAKRIIKLSADSSFSVNDSISSKK